MTEHRPTHLLEHATIDLAGCAFRVSDPSNEGDRARIYIEGQHGDFGTLTVWFDFDAYDALVAAMREALKRQGAPKPAIEAAPDPVPALDAEAVPF